MAEYGQGFLSNLEQFLDPPMKRKIEDLRNLIPYIESLQTNHDKVVYNINVSSWLKESRLVLSEICELRIEDKIHQNFPQGMRENLYQRFNLVLRIHGMRDAVTRLLENGRTALEKFRRSCTIDIVGRQAADAYEKIMQKVSQVQNKGIIMVSGRPGVGKTAVVSEIYSHALESASFHQVIWVTGASNATLEDLHKEIAFQMNVPLSEARDNVERAKTLEYALTRNKRRRQVLLIIELWKDFPLEAIGIPKPTGENRLKLVIVCRTLLAGRSIKKGSGYQVHDHEIKCLSEWDANNLFHELVGQEVFNSLSVETRISLLIERCDLLPYMIVNAGEGLKKWFHDNKDEVDDIPIGGMTRALDSVNFTCDALENSYQSLSEETRVYFLYCALFPSKSDYGLIETEDMIRYWICEGLMGDNREALVTDTMLKQGKDILDEIENVYLVEIVYRDDESKKECIKMNQSVREMAVHISRTQYTSHRFLIQVGNGITKQIGRLSEVKRASVMSDVQVEEFGRQSMNSLSTLVVRNQQHVDHNQDLSLPERLFNYMPNVKVLDLSGTHTESFRGSFHRLRNLRALHLRGCRNLSCLPDVSCFLELLVLDLSHTRITELPNGLRMLTKLLRLDVSGTPMRKFPFPDGLLTDLTDLQELLMLSSYLWTGQESTEDLNRLTQLAHLEANVSNLEALRIFLQFGLYPSRFKFCIGELFLDQKLGENTLAVLIDDIVVSDIELLTVQLPVDNSTLHLMFNKNLEYLQFQYNTPASLQHLTSINVSDCGGLGYLFQADMLQGMANLRKIVVKRCKNMDRLIQGSSSSYDEFSLGNLRELVLFQLDKLEGICRPKIKCESLECICRPKIKCESLESISVWDCDKLRSMPDVVNRENNPILLKGHYDWLSRIIVLNHMYTKFAGAKAPQELYSMPTYTDLSDRQPQEQRQSVVTFMWLVWFCIVAFSSIPRFVFRRLQLDSQEEKLD